MKDQWPSDQTARRLRTLLSLLALVITAGVATMAVTAREARSPQATDRILLPLAVRLDGLLPVAVGAGFDHVTEVTHAGDERLFVVELAGVVKILHPDGTVASFLDISDRVITQGGEYGLFDIAFHPDYRDPASDGYGFFYVTYTTGTDDGQNRDVDLILSRFSVSVDPDVADPDSETLILIEPQQGPVHKGGAIDFDHRDNMLYAGVGDDWLYLAAQKSNSPKGKIIRLDVDRVPRDAGPDGKEYVRYEIVAFGLRNPWRIDVDEPTGRIFIGDVGDSRWEEVNLLTLPEVANFGWPCLEGPFKNPAYADADECRRTFTPAIYEYPHDDAKGTCAIMGGRVYRPASNPGDGRYIFGDLCNRELSAISEAGDGWAYSRLGQHPYEVFAAIGNGADGTLYLGSFRRSAPIYRLYFP